MGQVLLNMRRRKPASVPRYPVLLATAGWSLVPLRYLRYADKALYSIPNNRLTASTPKINVVTTGHPLSSWISAYALYMKAP